MFILLTLTPKMSIAHEVKDGPLLGQERSHEYCTNISGQRFKETGRAVPAL
jgi:hypothetical protein